MIFSFADDTTEDIYNGLPSKKALGVPRELWPIARRKLDMLNAASSTNDLMIPPSNRLQRMKGSLSAYYSIRVNDRYRILFRWNGRDAEAVHITDYH